MSTACDCGGRGAPPLCTNGCTAMPHLKTCALTVWMDTPNHTEECALRVAARARASQDGRCPDTNPDGGERCIRQTGHEGEHAGFERVRAVPQPREQDYPDKRSWLVALAAWRPGMRAV